MLQPVPLVPELGGWQGLGTETHRPSWDRRALCPLRRGTRCKVTTLSRPWVASDRVEAQGPPSRCGSPVWHVF